jgi:hypothetical protein
LDTALAILDRIIIEFPGAHREFAVAFLSLIKPLGKTEHNLFSPVNPNPDFVPKISLNFQSMPSGVAAQFILSDNETIKVKVENLTGEYKTSPHAYRHISVAEVNQRLAASRIEIIETDHLGFNLPWFSAGLHPDIIRLRQELASRCLYHRYPTGEPWDFILPGDDEEITGGRQVDYSKVRRPKFELVSFEKTSTPLVQFDINVNASFENFSQLFPEALADSQFRNVWVYLENPYNVDLCLVINEYTASDWSEYFKSYRITT